MLIFSAEALVCRSSDAKQLGGEPVVISHSAYTMGYIKLAYVNCVYSIFLAYMYEVHGNRSK